MFELTLLSKITFAQAVHPPVREFRPRHFGRHSEPRSGLEATKLVTEKAPAPTLLTCSMGSSVDAQGESKIDTYTYIILSACSWRPSLNEEER